MQWFKRTQEKGGREIKKAYRHGEVIIELQEFTPEKEKKLYEIIADS